MLTHNETESRRQQLYHQGRTGAFACNFDPRFNFSLFVPENISDSQSIHLLISVHGSFRNRETYRETFVEFGRHTNTVVLAPLFPIGVLGDDNPDGYKYIIEGDIRYDHVLIEMINQVEEMLDCNFPPAMLFGFSGGGHFSNRFMLLHPERLSAVSIGAPGSVTQIDENHDWWAGTRSVEKVFGQPINLQVLKGMKVHLVVGGADTEDWEITHRPGSRYWVEGANAAGKNRVERILSLAKNLRDHGVDVKQETIPGAMHSLSDIAPHVIHFFRDVIGQNDKEV